MIRVLSVFFQRELTKIFCNIFSLVLPLFFFLAILFLLAVLSDDQSGENIYSHTWVVLVLMALIGGNKQLEKNMQNGEVESLFLLGISLPVFVLGHIIMFWCVSLMPLILLVACIGKIMSTPPANYLDLCIGSFSLAALATLSSSITTPIKKNNFMGPLLMIPIGIPLFVLLGMGHNAIDAQPFSFLQGAYLLMIAPICTLVGASALKQEMSSR